MSASPAPRAVLRDDALLDALDASAQDAAAVAASGLPLNGDSTAPATAAARLSATALTPRQYQWQLFERAREGNVVAVLDTGAGKTLVSVLLLQHVLDEETARVESLAAVADGAPPLRRRTSVFLVNQVPLVHQQAQVISDNSTLSVGKLFGELGVDTWSAPQWAEMMGGRYDVLVATAQCVLTGLIHGFVRMADLALVIFDEAHHAAATHPYARIMSCYRAADGAHLPKIFGMTASPLKSSSSFEEAASDLEAMLDARIFTAPLSARLELAEAVQKPRELVVEYDAPPAMPPSQLTKLIEESCGHLDGIEKVLDRIEYTNAELGPLMADLAWVASRADLRASAERNERLARMPTEQLELELINRRWRGGSAPLAAPGAAEAAAPADPERRQKLQSKAALNRAISDVLARVPLPEQLTVTEANSCPKVHRLLEVLACFGVNTHVASSLCGIIFVARRTTAVALVELIRRLPQLSFISAEWLVGHNPAADIGMSWQTQMHVLERFRSKRTNLLVATTVAEEGLDIRSCNFVIRFDMFDTHIGFVQSRGRARHPDSRIVMMLQREHEASLKTLRAVARADGEMKEWLRNLPADRLAELAVDEDGQDTPPEEHVWLDSEATGARLYPADAIPLVCRYVAMLRQDEYSPMTPDFTVLALDEGFMATLKLPANAKVRSVVGPLAPRKKSAKRLAAFEACCALRKIGVLDDHLVPRLPPKPGKELPFERNEQGELLGTRSRQVAHFLKDAAPFGILAEGDLQMHATLLRVPRHQAGKSFRDFCMLTSAPVPAIPSFNLLFHEGPLPFAGVDGSTVMSLSREAAANAREYTMRLVRYMTRRNWTCEAFPFYLVPLVGGGSAATDVDWEEVARGGSPGDDVQLLADTDLLPKRGSQLDSLADRVLAESPNVNSTPLYEATGLRSDLNPHSTLDPERDAHMREAQAGSYAEYNTKTFWSTRTPPGEPSATEPLISVEKLGRVENFLSSSVKRHGQPKRSSASLLIPSRSWLHRLGAAAMRSSLVLPSILTRMEQFVLAREANRLLLRSRLDDTYLLVALTAPSAKQSFTYERKEFLGDTALKLIATCYVFAKRPDDAEGALDLARKEIVANAVLMRIAERHELWRYVHVQDLSRKIYRPSNFVLVPNVLQDAAAEAAPGADSEQAPEAASEQVSETATGPPQLDAMDTAGSVGREKVTSEKTLADLVEALLGASLETGGIDSCLQTASDLGVLPERIESWASLQAVHSAQLSSDGLEGERVSLGALRKLEAWLQYIFRSPHLALEALTHPSLLASALPSFERLEFLGDAILDFFVVEHFRITYPELDEGGLTVLKSNAVSNAALGALAESTGLYKFLQHAQPDLTQAIVEFTSECRLRREAEERQAHEARTQYWHGLAPPKAIADIAESLLGAVFVDAGFSLAAAQGVFDRFFLPFVKRYVSPATTVIASSKTLASMLHSRGCTDWLVDFVDGPSAPAETPLVGLFGSAPQGGTSVVRCRLVCHGKVLADATGKSRKAAMMASAQLLEAENFAALDALCDCRKKGAAREN